jgi:hypothetical protein
VLGPDDVPNLVEEFFGRILHTAPPFDLGIEILYIISQIWREGK